MLVPSHFRLAAWFTVPCRSVGFKPLRECKSVPLTKGQNLRTDRNRQETLEEHAEEQVTMKRVFLQRAVKRLLKMANLLSSGVCRPASVCLLSNLDLASQPFPQVQRPVRQLPCGTAALGTQSFQILLPNCVLVHAMDTYIQNQ